MKGKKRKIFSSPKISKQISLNIYVFAKRVNNVAITKFNTLRRKCLNWTNLGMRDSTMTAIVEEEKDETLHFDAV